MNKIHFKFATPEQSPGFLLWQTTIIWQYLIKKSLEKYNISHAQFVIMALLLSLDKQKKEITQSNVTKISKLDKMTISKSLKKLVKLKLVKRYENEKDARAKTVFLTPIGKKLICKLIPMVENIDFIFFEKLKSKEQSDLIKILQKLTADKASKKQ
ncbi:MAG: MarR family winged helix-turn-helix transcriptional regulator [Candidatus Babeliales bacterium]